MAGRKKGPSCTKRNRKQLKSTAGENPSGGGGAGSAGGGAAGGAAGTLKYATYT